jgi:2-dehydropantoate 2-reductase
MGGVLVIGAGAVGGYIAAHLAHAGEAVTVFEPWAPNREALQARGLTVEEPSGDLHIPLATIAAASDIAALRPSLVILCTKLADAQATVDAIEPHYRGPYLVTLNALADFDLARQLGAARIMGCIVTGLFARLAEPGRLQRHRRRHDGGAATFRIGETHGPATPRVHALVDLLGKADGAEAVDDLAAARWTKMVFNCMTSPLCALRRTTLRALFLESPLRAELTAVALEVVRVAAAVGVALDPICGISGTIWRDAARSDLAALAAVEAGLLRYGQKVDPGATSGMAQDHARGRRTEVSLINGAVVAEAARHGLGAPANAALVVALDSA